MTTIIKINGLDVEFSDNVPTRAGFWLWSKDVNTTIYPTRVWQAGHMFASSELGSYTCVDDIGGIWSTSPLVPAVEVQRGYIEGHTSCIGRIPYNDSRAKRVVEGTLE